ncbi:MAG: (Fe-S)-binding protein [Alphaproteobacteria bacterium]|nr:MAG: (Fe-S)-binding protein [Alphaproteobacteria bacterium]
MTTRNVGFFVTCLVDLYRPSVGFAAIELLTRAGCAVHVPEAQTCCGQPAYNAGDPGNAKAIAQQVITAFEGFDYVVAPSGSCAGMLKHHYKELFKDDTQWLPRAEALSARTWELTSFLTDVCGVSKVEGTLPAKVAYHDSCAANREMQVHTQPRRLLSSIEGLELVELKNPNSCCGFGGLFSVKYGEISEQIVESKIGEVNEAAPDILVGPDLGCLLSMAGKLKRDGAAIEVRHIAEVLAGKLDTAPLAAPRT